MIESMANGTPVIAYKSYGRDRKGLKSTGAVGEVIDHGVTGFAIDAPTSSMGEREAVRAVARIDQLDRHKVREVFDQNWTGYREAERVTELFYERLRIAQENRDLKKTLNNSRETGRWY